MRSSNALWSIPFVAGLLGVVLYTLPSYAQEPNEGLEFRLGAVGGELKLGNEFETAVFLDSDLDDIDGWSFGVTHDPELLELVRVDVGDATRGANNGSTPDLLVINEEPEGGVGVTMGVVINFQAAATLSAGTGYELLRLRYRVVGDPSQNDPCEPIETTIDFTSDLGNIPNTPIAPRVVVEGLSEQPVLTSASVAIGCPGAIEISRCEGGLDDVQLEWFFDGEVNWDFLFLYKDGEFMEMLEPDATDYSETEVSPGTHDYTLVTFIVEDPRQPQLISTHCAATVNPVTVTSFAPSTGDWLGNENFTIEGTAFTVPENIAVSLIGASSETAGLILPLEVVEVVSDTELTVRTSESPSLGLFDVEVEVDFGVLTLPEAFEFGFVRGEVNSDGLIDQSDSVALLEYLFLGTFGPPRCLDSADANDDGNIDVSDSVIILWFLFVGQLSPAPPFPEPGRDPTEDDLDCIE